MPIGECGPGGLIASDDDGADPHPIVTFACPERLSRWQPLVRWLLAARASSCGRCSASPRSRSSGFFAVLITGAYPPFSLRG